MAEEMVRMRAMQVILAAGRRRHPGEEFEVNILRAVKLSREGKAEIIPDRPAADELPGMGGPAIEVAAYRVPIANRLNGRGRIP